MTGTLKMKQFKCFCPTHACTTQTSVAPIVILLHFWKKLGNQNYFWCVNGKEFSNIDRENNFLVFVSNHLAKAQNG